MDTRRLQLQDSASLERFLRSHRDSSMFLRANVARGGLQREADEALKGDGDIYVGAFEGGSLVGVVSQNAGGMLLLQAGGCAALLSQECLRMSQRPVTGVVGPPPQVAEVQEAVGLRSRNATYNSNERLYGLELSDLLVPSSLSSGALSTRKPRAAERDILCAWRMAYDMELLGATDNPANRARSAYFLDKQIAEGNVRIALDAEIPVSLSALNAALPDCVQLGGIYTPPELRGRGFAKAAVAASLMAARDAGVERAVLFTGNPSAIRTYEALGFQQTGDYAVALYE